MPATAEVDGNVTLRHAKQQPRGALYRGLPPSQTVKLTIMRLHETTTRSVLCGLVRLRRQVAGYTYYQSYLRGIVRHQDSAGLRLTWGRNCPYTLYDVDCKVKPGNFVVAGLTISAMDGVSITVIYRKTCRRVGLMQVHRVDGRRRARGACQ
ncbi:Uncharacterised protein [Aggregatibacter aphrophilus]|uniref:Uncharacterized protein n=1 Tax=Aggregatibacter aphrophilus TaxID=732 RepID=A0A336NHJ6_AGGAP|nr:Uncharacterised protein [Aggregatibacter aphrophilus]